jgi:hypothetical protein
MALEWTRQAARRKLLSRWVALASLVTLFAAATASPAGAVTIGQLAPDGATFLICTSDTDRVPLTIASGNSYVVPSTGGVTEWTLTSWSHNATSGDGQQLTMKVFRKVGEPLRYMAVGHDGPRPLVPSTLNTFQTSMQVKAGDVLGSNGESPVASGCRWSTGDPGDSYTQIIPSLADGQSGDGSGNQFNIRLNVSAEIMPTNTFTLGAITRNKRKGTASVAAQVPNPGELSVSGNGVKAAGARSAATTVGTAGTATVVVKASGKKKRKLNENGKVKVTPTITYTPTGGSPKSISTKVKLRKKL